MRCENREKHGGRRDAKGLNLEGWRINNKYREKQKRREFGIPERRTKVNIEVCILLTCVIS